MTDKREQIQTLFREVQAKLEEARELSVEAKLDNPNTWATHHSFYFDGPAYGMGGYLEAGEWQPSSGSC